MPFLIQSNLYNSRRNHNLGSYSLGRYYCRFCKRGYKLKDELISHKKQEHGDKMKIERELQKLSERKLKIERKLEKLNQRDRQTAMSVNGTVVNDFEENVTKEEWTTDTSMDAVEIRDRNVISGAGESSERIAAGEDTNYSLLEGELTKIQAKSYKNGTELRTSTGMENSSVSMQIGENDSEAALELELEVLLSEKNRGRSYGETNDGLKNNFYDPVVSSFSHPELSPSVDTNMTMSPADLFVEKLVTTTLESETTTSVKNTEVEVVCNEFESEFDSDVEILPTPVPEEKLVEVIDLLDDFDDGLRDIENEGVPNRQQPVQRTIIDDKGSTNTETIAAAEHMDYRDIEFDAFLPEIQSKSSENCTEKQIMRNACNSNEKVQDGTNGNEIIIIQDNISRDHQHPSAFTINTSGSISTSTVETETISGISSCSFVNVNDSPSNLTSATMVIEATSISVENGENGSEAAQEVLLSEKNQSRSYEDDSNNDELKNNFYDTSASEFSQPQLSPSIETEAEMAILRIDKSAANLLVEKSVSSTTTTMESKDDDDGDIVPHAASSNLMSLINVRVTKEQEGTATNAVVKEDCDEFETSSNKSDFDSDVEIIPTPVPEKKVVEVIDLLGDSDDDIHNIENQRTGLPKNRLPYYLPGRTQNSKCRQQKEITKHVILYRTRCSSNRSQAQRRGRQQPMQKNNNINESKAALLDGVNRAHKISEDKKYSTHMGHIMGTTSQITTRFEMTPSKYGPKPEMYKCGQCRNAFSDAHLLSLHVRHAHPPGKVRVRLNSFWEMRK